MFRTKLPVANIRYTPGSKYIYIYVWLYIYTSARWGKVMIWSFPSIHGPTRFPDTLLHLVSFRHSPAWWSHDMPTLQGCQKRPDPPRSPAQGHCCIIPKRSMWLVYYLLYSWRHKNQPKFIVDQEKIYVPYQSHWNPSWHPEDSLTKLRWRFHPSMAWPSSDPMLPRFSPVTVDLLVWCLENEEKIHILQMVRWWFQWWFTMVESVKNRQLNKQQVMIVDAYVEI